MKKLFLLFTLIFLFFIAYPQKTILNPNHGYTNASYVKITKIEITDSATALHFDVTFRPGLAVPVKTYIKSVNSDTLMFVERAEGITLGERLIKPSSGLNKYILYFPPLDDTVQMIDFGEDVGENSWKIYDIEIVPKPWESLLPEFMGGTWFRADGSNSWEFGLFRDFAIHKSDYWEYEKVEKKGKLYTVLLRNRSGSVAIYAKAGKNDKVLLGDNPKNLVSYSTQAITDPKFSIKDDEGFTGPVFKMDSAIYKGCIYGYTPRIGINSGMIYVNSILSPEPESYSFTITESGTFEVKFPMYYPKELLVRSAAFIGPVYLEPGKTTFHFINGGDNLFMGDCSRVNSDLAATSYINTFNQNKLLRTVLDMSPKEYKDFILEAMESDFEAFNAYRKTHQVSLKAAKIKELAFLYKHATLTFEINTMRMTAYRNKYKVPRDQIQIPLQPLNLTPDFYRFSEELPVNEPISTVTNNYDAFIKRLKYTQMSSITKPFSLLEVLEKLEESGVKVDDTIKESALALIDMEKKPDRGKAQEEYTAKYGTSLMDFIKEHNVKINEISLAWLADMRVTFLKEVYGIENGVALDIMKCQDYSQRINSFNPLSEDDLASLNEQFSMPFFSEYLEKKNFEILAKIEANKQKIGYSLRETPVAEADKIFDAIIERYKGKVVLVDFWATWCGPCLSGIKTIAPLKEELGDSAIVFLYITNPTSPETIWKNMIPDIRGEHYRLNQEEWKILATRFNIRGIPHYMLVDKQGNVVKDKIQFASLNDELRKMIEEYLNQMVK